MIAQLLLVLLTTQAPDSGQLTASGIWYSVTGKGPPLLLIHGSNLDSRSWGALPAALARDHRVIQMDLRSHGRSRDATGPFSWVDDALEVLDAAGSRRATLIGHSLGATIAIDLALTHPDRVAGLVLIGPAISGMKMTLPPAEYAEFMAALQKGDLAAAGDALGRTPVARMFGDSSRREAVRASLRENVRLFRVSREWLKPIDPPAFGRLEQISVPTLALWGASDPTDSPEAGRALRKRVPHAEGEIIPQCGHLMPLDCPTGTLASVRKFLAKRRL